jgi:aryl-alcohol dehydrogenase-like predicted oxidoreductase
LTNYLGKYSPEQLDQREQVIAAIQYAADRGVNYFDTAASYGSGQSERIFGEALAGRLTHPADVLLGELFAPDPAEGFEPVGRSAGESGTLSPHAQDTEPEPIFLATKVSHKEPDIRGSVERSLRNLRVDRIDLVQIHGGSYSEADEARVLERGGVLDILEKARDEGLVRHIGFTTEDQNPAVYRFIASGRFEVMQIQYNLLFQHPYSPDRPFGSMIAAQKAGMGIVTMRSLTSGVFQHWMRSVRPHDDFDYSAALLQFVLSNPLVNVALAGMRTTDEVNRNIAVLQKLSGRIDLDDLHEKYIQ